MWDEMSYEYPRDFIPIYGDFAYHRETRKVYEVGINGECTLLTGQDGKPIIYEDD